MVRQNNQERASEAVWSAEHEDELLKHLPASFRVLARFVLKEGDSDARRTRIT